MLAITITLALPAAVHLLVRYYEQELMRRARATPLVLGAPGNRYDLIMGALYFRNVQLRDVANRHVSRIQESGLAVPVPLHVRFSAQGHPVVGTTLDYLEFRGLRLAAGRLPQVLGEAVLGAAVAASTGLGPGDSLLTDQENLYDLAATYPLKMHIVGVLAEAHGADDHAVLVDIRTAWVIEGIGHGHRDLTADGDPERQPVVQASDALVQYMEVTPENLASFHFHGDEDEFPLSAIIVLPHDQRSETLLKARYSMSETSQLLVPTEVVEDLLGIVLHVRRFLDANFLLVAVATTLLVVLVVWLSLRLRRRERETMHRIGCSRWMVVKLQAGELLLILLSSTILTGGLLVVARLVAPLFIHLT
jgi:putative ABC transport system permease protein